MSTPIASGVAWGSFGSPVLDMIEVRERADRES